MFDWSGGKIAHRVSSFPDDSYAIDFILDPNVVRKIYKAWDESVNGELVDYGGGVRAITAKMLWEAGVEFLTGIKNIGQIRATQVLEDIGASLKETPYGGGV